MAVATVLVGEGSTAGVPLSPPYTTSCGSMGLEGMDVACIVVGERKERTLLIGAIMLFIYYSVCVSSLFL